MTGLVSRIRGVAPDWSRRTWQRIKMAREFYQDYRLYVGSTEFYKGGKPGKFRDEKEVLEARVRLSYHSLEKGQSFPEPRRPYGLEKIGRIKYFLRSADDRGIVLGSGSHAQDAIAATEAFNEGADISDELAPVVATKLPHVAATEIEKFAASRHSVRNFDPTALLDAEEVQHAIEIASRSTPSVCNRRSYRAHFYTDREQIDSLLKLQNGNRGFGHEAPGLLVVTVRRSSFIGANERNQRWIDGGLFAMTLVWTLHACGIGTCMLNWSQSNARSTELRRRGDIPDTEDVIVLIAVGHPREGFRAAKSPHRPAAETAVSH